MSNTFKFKAFEVNQDQCAMKIGTDGVLLGAWSTLQHKPFSILDIGAGTGVIALMLAQRSNAEVIDALEIDDDAYEQCVDNFEQSPWGDRLFCYHAALDEFANEIEDKYDLIVCNPPFYAEDYKTENKQRDMARFQDAMPFQHLLESVSILLETDGYFCVIIPFSETDHFISLAQAYKLYPNTILHVKGHPDAKMKRSLIAFSRSEMSFTSKTLIIENQRHKYTKNYIALTKDFYLNM